MALKLEMAADSLKSVVEGTNIFKINSKIALDHVDDVNDTERTDVSYIQLWHLQKILKMVTLQMKK